MSWEKAYLSTVMAVIVAAAHLLAAQTNPDPRLGEAFALERDGQTKQSIAALQALVDSGSLNTPDTGKAWNILALAYEDRGDFTDAQRAVAQEIPAPADERLMTTKRSMPEVMSAGQLGLAPYHAQNAVQTVQHAQGNHKDQPPGEYMKEPFGLVRISILDEQPRTHNSRAIGNDRDGHRGKGEQHPHRDISIHQTAVDDRQCGQRHERANATAGFLLLREPWQAG